MLFNSIDFLMFFPIAVLVYFLLPGRVRYLWLLACSYYFYMNWNPRYALLILFSTAVTYLSGLVLGRLEQCPPPAHTCLCFAQKRFALLYRSSPIWGF